MRLEAFKKKVSIIIAFLVFALAVPETVSASAGDVFLTLKDSELYALSACLMDADNGRVLYGKNVDDVRAMASTTKIMTLIIALEYGNADDIVTISPYAASMPDVQLNVRAGEQYRLVDLCYAMMLESFNDVAVAIAEYVGEKYGMLEDFQKSGSTENLTDEKADITNEAKDNSESQTYSQDADNRSYDESRRYVKKFADLMNAKARELGCTDTYFITPNGLDAEDENGKHSTTARELALIASYAIKNDEFNNITGTKQYSFNEINEKRSCTAYNKDAFLNQMSGAFGIKTGFTGDAGYCFVGALRSDGRTFISVVLGSGWPSNRTYKWKDTRKLMEYGINNFFEKTVFSSVEEYKKVEVTDGIADSTGSRIDGLLSMLLCDADDVRVIYEIEDSVPAPVDIGDVLGKAIVYINGERMEEFPITATNKVERVDYKWYLQKLLDLMWL